MGGGGGGDGETWWELVLSLGWLVLMLVDAVSGVNISGSWYVGVLMVLLGEFDVFVG